MNRKESSREFSLLIMTVFFIMSFLLLVTFGTQIYRNIAVSQEQSSLSRTLSSYLHTASKMNEAGIETKHQEGRTVLIIEDRDTGYGNRIYLQDGYLVEDFGKLDDELHADSALRIGKTDVFEIEQIDDDLLKVTTGDGIVYLTLMKGGR